ncbi:MAG: hypothetical protein PHF86_02210 [Candidatus Nanoarchaeia archaeon]|nr:hypothetical protein [Candidatus Nanoarchaeia archaeon]
MLLSELVNQVKNELTASCSLPYSPPDKEIERIISKEMRFLFREYRTLLQDRIYIIHERYYQTPEWKNTRTFQMNNCTEGIKQVMEMNGGNRVFGINDPDLNFDRLMASDLYLTPLSSDQITYRTIQWSFWDLARAFNLKDINHDFNPNTHRLIITGRTPIHSLFVLGMDHIPLEEAYEDTIVIEWIIAKCKLSLARVLGAFNYNLLGNITINFEQYRLEGNEELERLREKIKGDNPPDWFVLFP